jgi:predicted RNase H-like nuclease (RuvC/YqgF family)
MSFLQELKQKLEKGVETAGQMSQQMLEISRLTLRIKGKKDDIDRLIANLGREVYQTWEQNQDLTESEAINQLLKTVRDQYEQLHALQQELEVLKRSDQQADHAEEVTPTLVDGRSDDLATVEALPQAEEHQDAPASIDMGGTRVAVLYLCPFCAHQVESEATSCSHCHKRFY